MDRLGSLTVVVPTYNRAALLDEALRSILAQTVAPDEIIVVDDGSTDDTAAVCARYRDTVRYLRQDNSGLPAVARNRGMEAATGDWIALCDSDDLWHPRKLEIQLEVARALGVEWVVSGFGMIDPEGKRLAGSDLGFEREFPVFRHEHVGADAYFARWLTRAAVASAAESPTVYHGDAFGMLFEGNVCLTSSALMKRSLLARSGMFDPWFRRAEDTEFFHRVAAHAPLAIVMASLLEYRVGHPSVMSVRDLSPFMTFTLESLERAAKLRPNMTPRERAAHRRGRERLRMALAYDRLSSMDGAGARAALRAGWRENELRSPFAAAIWAASWMPKSVLTAVHRAKASARSALKRKSGTSPQPEKQRVRTDEYDHDRTGKAAHGSEAG
jgi:glycosyltransferase involved in cell wall biosynthesis